jgi:type I restriction enzyme, S subunit
MRQETWAPRKLNELGFVGRGKSKHRPRNEPSLYGGKYPFVQTGDIKAAELYLREYTQTYNDKGLAQSKLWKPGTLCITIAANIAETAILGMEACFPDSVVGFVADEEKSDIRFIKYYIDTIKLRMQNISRGTTQDNLSLEKLYTFDIFTPPLPVQHKIAEVLSAYDDLIEVNTRRIRILEQMAQSVYREWFGMVNGWEKKPFSELVEIDPTILVDKQVEKPFVGMNALSTNSMIIDLDLVETRTGSSGAKFQNRDVLFPRITPSVENGKAAFVQFLNDGQVAIGSTEIIVFREKEINAEYIYFLSRGHEFRGNAINSMVGASGRQRVQQGCFNTFLVARSPKELLQNFSETVAPTFKITHTLALKNANLRRTRDLLLPRLISGEVSIHE